MERRKFIQNLGVGIAPVVLPKLDTNAEKEFPTYEYLQPRSLKEAVNKDGQIMVRLEFTAEGRIATELTSQVRIKNGKISRSRDWFFERGTDQYIPETGELIMEQANSETDVLVLWLDVFSEKTEIVIKGENVGQGKGEDLFAFTLNDLIENLEAKGQIGGTNISANFLLDREIGELDPANVGVQVDGNDFVFVIMADPQGADVSNPADNRCRSKIHNAFVEESVRLANNLKVKPAFCLMLGDIVDYQGEARDFAQMATFFEKLEMPVLYEMGNHESRYRAQFVPGYNFSEFNNYFAAQKAINGMDYLLYSFNLGQWHFVVWPDPLRKTFWENHPHYFDWLERDLEKHQDKPTIFMQHIPMQPVGINPLINYAESVRVKRLLFDILSKHGNVKTIYSGHVHIPVKSSFKTAVSYKGINCINLPAAGYRPRAFGEQDFNGGPTQGIAIVAVKGDKVETTFKTVTLEEYKYPDELPVFDAKKYPLWLKYKWELPAEKKFVNGDFQNNLENWGRRFVYEEDVHPANICEVRTEPFSGTMALYLKTRRRGFCTPGQDRLPQDINRIFQAVQIEPDTNPVLEFEYRIDGAYTDFNGFCGAYIWVEGFKGTAQVASLFYFVNKAWVNVGGTYGRTNRLEPVIFSLDKIPDTWHKVQVNIQKDFDKNPGGMRFGEAWPDRVVLSLGTWNVNDGEVQPFAIWFNNIKLNYDSNALSNVNGNPVHLTREEEKWWRGKNQPAANIAGEHHYFTNDWDTLQY